MVGSVETLVLDDRRIAIVLGKALGLGWGLEKLHMKRASVGLTGFLGDHFRATLHAAHPSGQKATLHLFIKHLPMNNEAKANLIDEGNYYRREALSYRLFEELGGDHGPDQWRPKSLYCDDRVLVMPDLSLEGFAPCHFLSKFRLSEVQLAAASAARMHAAFADYSTRRTAQMNTPYNFLQDHQDLMQEPVFCDGPFLRAAAKLSANILNKFSNKYCNTIEDMEPKIYQLYLEACNTLRDYPETLNVLLHKDLWVNNILFAPGKAVIVDYQCVRYGPPAFDVLMLLYLTTTREFRETHEQEVFHNYYSIFSKSVNADTKLRLKEIGYDREAFLCWCERGRMFGLFFAIAIFPYVLMEPSAAQQHYDNPDTYLQYCNENRTEPVFQHGADSPNYLEYQLKATEEFIDRYLCQLK